MAIVATYFAASSVLLLALGVLLLLALLTHDRDPEPFVSRAVIALILVGAIVFSFPDLVGPAAGGAAEVSTSPTDFPPEDQRTIVSE
jgi:hypothetical protein